MTGKDWTSNVGRTMAILLVMVMLASLVAVGRTPVAQGSEPPFVDAPSAPDAAPKVGVEWVAQFDTCPANDLPNCTEPECMKLYNALVGEGWDGEFHYGNNSAWETDFKRSAAGGYENSYIDRVDLGLFCSHGSGTSDAFWGENLSSLYFGYPHNDCHLTPGEAYDSYGDYNLEWFAFFACSVLSDGGPAPYYNRGYWASTMDGLHLMLGMKTTMYCSSQIGQKWAHYMLGYKWCFLGTCFWIIPPYKITQAWFEATDDTQPGGVCARVLAEVQDNYNDHLWQRGYVSPDPVSNSIYWYWDHCSCTPPPVQTQGVEQIEALPVLSVMDRNVDEQFVFDIGAAFNLADTGVYSDTEYYYMMGSTGVETYTLQVDKTSGGYKYRNVSELWVPPPMTPTLPSEAVATRIGNEFFLGAGAGLPAVQYRNGEILTMVEEMVEVQLEEMGAGRTEEQELRRIPVDVSVSYGRVIEVQAESSGGTVQQVLSIVGPGARTKVYVGDMGQIIGVQGGSRDVQETGEFVEIIGAGEAWNLFLGDPSIALATIPWAYDEVVQTPGVGPTLGYYEEPQAQGQQELVPTWIFTADFYAAGEPLAQGVLVYVPAAAEYLPPEVQIDAPAPGSTFSPGEMVTFSGSVVQHGQAPFTYEWYSSHDGFLGSGATIEAPLTGAAQKGTVISHTISLQVVDANGQEGAASEMVFVRTAVYLPIILKGQ